MFEGLSLHRRQPLRTRGDGDQALALPHTRVSFLMPRAARVVQTGVPLHIVQRGVDRVRTFHAEADFLHYRDDLKAAIDATGVMLHAYVFMPNHVHLLLTPPEPSAPARTMRRLGARYVRYINATYARTGTLWEGRFRSALVDTERYLLRCIRYIELNPVRAGLVSVPEHYRWSSFRCHAFGEPDPLVTPHALYLAQHPAPAMRQSAHAAFCQRVLALDELQAFRLTVRGTHQRAGARQGTEFERLADRPLRKSAYPANEASWIF